MINLRYAATRTPSSSQIGSVIKPAFPQSTAGSVRILRRIQSSQVHSLSSPSRTSSRLIYPAPLRSQFLPDEISTNFALSTIRSLHQSARLREEKLATSAAKEEPQTGKNRERQTSSETSEPESQAEGKEEAKEEGKEAKDEGKQEEQQEAKDGEGKKEKKEDAPPPPPHGDKSPWQVFTDTLQSEFKASKEWNESTKALAAGAQQFTENESVRRAREAYERSTGAVSSTTAKVLKTTAGAVGKGAAWTWETPVVKGVRTTVNATATVIEKGTRPIRETEAYKNVKDVIDDGSSSRYGGWVEKEERRKAREKRELEEAQKAGLSGKRVEVLKEDPK